MFSFNKYCQFSKVSLLIYTLTSTILELQLLRILTSTCECFLCHFSLSGRCVLVMHRDFDLLSLMTKLDHLFICLLVIWISFFEKFLLKYLPISLLHCLPFS